MAVNDSKSALWDFMTEGGWTFPVMLDADSAAVAYGVRPIPTTILIDAEGRIAKKVIGTVSAADLSAMVDDLTR